MRAPGGTHGLFAVESALDELSYTLGIDPIELRLRNYAEVDPESGLPWSSKALRECYVVGAERFGWAAAYARDRIDARREPAGRLRHARRHVHVRPGTL
jgi:CO/xanthine dehydrogenase Mo-binding subunit